MNEDAPGAHALQIADYIVFALMLLVSAGVGLYCARIGRSQSNSRDFLTGGRKLTALPVSLSLTTGILSSVILLSLPVEVYCYGAIIGYTGIAYFLAQVCTSEIFLPVFYRLAITSTFQYLELRFNRATRLLATLVTIIQAFLITGLVIYAPALALNQVTGWNLWILIFVTGMVCTMCCTLGGMKAVVWINVFQIGIIFAGLLSVICKCLLLEGAISILSISQQGGRINFLDFDLNPLRRHTFWTIVIGGTVGWTMASGTNQSQVQKYNSCKSIIHARIAVLISLASFWLVLVSVVFLGLCLYSFYKNCDPWTAGLISSPDQMMPYLVMDILKDYPGLPGLFLAAVYSGTLSTVSSIINAMAAVTLEDLIKPYIRLTDRQLLHISRGLSVCFGVVCIAMAGLASLMGLLVQARAVIGGVAGGPMFGLFVLGILCPFANSKGGLFGLAFGSAATLAVTVGHMLSSSDPEMSRPLSISTEGCNVTTAGSVNWTTALPPQLNLSAMFEVRNGTIHWTSNWHSPSYLYFSLIGLLTTVIVGMIVSIYTGGLNQRVEPRLMLMKEDTISYHLFKLIKYKIKKRTNGAKQGEMQETNNEGHVRMRMLHRRATSTAVEH